MESKDPDEFVTPGDSRGGEPQDESLRDREQALELQRCLDGWAGGSALDDGSDLGDFALRIGAQLRAEDRLPSAAAQRVIAQVHAELTRGGSIRAGTRAMVPANQNAGDRKAARDPSWRGDVGLVGDFLRQRLADSALLRLAAASLLVHLLAVPAVLAYVYLRPERPDVRLGFVLPPDPEPFGLAVPDVLEELHVPELGDSPLPSGEGADGWSTNADALGPDGRVSTRLGPSNARAWDAQLLRSVEVLRVARTMAQLPSDEGSDPLRQLLRGRARVLLGEQASIPPLAQSSMPAPTGPKGAEEAARVALGRLLATLRVEIGLDALALGGDYDPALTAGLERILAQQEPSQGSADPEMETSLRRLEARALERARSYGVPFRSLGDQGLGSSGAPGSTGALQGMLQPLDEAWQDDLRTVADALGMDRPQRLWESQR